MKVLENKTVDSKLEMDILDALQDIRARNARNERVGHSDELLSRLALQEVEEEEDAEQKRRKRRTKSWEWRRLILSSKENA